MSCAKDLHVTEKCFSFHTVSGIEYNGRQEKIKEYFRVKCCLDLYFRFIMLLLLVFVLKKIGKHLDVPE